MRIYSKSRQGYTNKQGCHAKKTKETSRKNYNQLEVMVERFCLEDVHENDLMSHIDL